MEAAMKAFAGTVVAVWGICVLIGCESSGNQYDGVSRFAGDSPYYGPGSLPREHPAPPAAEVPDTGSGESVQPNLG
jgi:hypothetical protein